MYLIALLFSLAGLAVIDVRLKLAFAKNFRAALLATSIPYLFFVVWDLAGINLHIFFKGQSKLLVGIELLPDFPLEELFFLALLTYSTLIVATFLNRGKK